MLPLKSTNFANKVYLLENFLSFPGARNITLIKKSLTRISERKMIKNINLILIPKQDYQNLQREASKFHYTKYS